MLPLVLLLVALEEAGVMQRIAFVVDRGFHQIGLHGGVAVPFSPAWAAMSRRSRPRPRSARAASGHRLGADHLRSCSARLRHHPSTGRKYLGGSGVFAIFALTIVVVALMDACWRATGANSARGRCRKSALCTAALALDAVRNLERTEDILTIVTPLLVGGSVCWPCCITLVPMRRSTRC